MNRRGRKRGSSRAREAWRKHKPARIKDLAEALGISRTTIDQAIAAGRLGSKKLGHARLIPIQDLIDWLGDRRVS